MAVPAADRQAARAAVEPVAGAVVETVEVSAAAQLIQSERSEVGQVIDSKRIVEMPLGIHRHVVRTVRYADRLYHLKELPRRYALREWRSQVVLETGKPAYTVLVDETLRGVAALRPTTPDELRAVKGLGPTSIDRYGPTLLAIVAGRRV